MVHVVSTKDYTFFFKHMYIHIFKYLFSYSIHIHIQVMFHTFVIMSFQLIKKVLLPQNIKKTSQTFLFHRHTYSIHKHAHQYHGQGQENKMFHFIVLFGFENNMLCIAWFLLRIVNTWRDKTFVSFRVILSRFKSKIE